MKSINSLAVLSLLATLLFVSSADAASTSPGKNSAYESFSGALPSTGGATTVVTAVISKGKAKRVLEASATLSVDGVAGTIGINLAAALLANGVPLQGPGTYSNVPNHHAQTCYEDESGLDVEGCTLTITGWLDLDAAELANPGVFIGQQINVTLSGGGFNAIVGNVSGSATLGARMEKK